MLGLLLTQRGAQGSFSACFALCGSCGIMLCTSGIQTWTPRAQVCNANTLQSTHSGDSQTSGAVAKSLSCRICRLCDLRCPQRLSVRGLCHEPCWPARRRQVCLASSSHPSRVLASRQRPGSEFSSLANMISLKFSRLPSATTTYHDRRPVFRHYIVTIFAATSPALSRTANVTSVFIRNRRSQHKMVNKRLGQGQYPTRWIAVLGTSPAERGPARYRSKRQQDCKPWMSTNM